MNRVEVSLYTDNDSIATMEESIIPKKSSIHRKNKVNYNLLLIQISKLAIKVKIGDKVLVASLVIIELLLLKQNKTDFRINKIDVIMN